MAVLTTERTARKEHRCARCNGRIKPGERYHDHAVTPNSDLGNEGWWHERTHISELCVTYADEPQPAEEPW